MKKLLLLFGQPQSAICVALGVLLITTQILHAEEEYRRNRGEGLYNCVSANTIGPGSVWLYGSAVGMVWDQADSLKKGFSLSNYFGAFRAFPEAEIDAGIVPWMSLSFKSRILTWGWAWGGYDAGVKLTTPDNRDLRMQGFGIEIKYQYRFTDGPPTLGGYYGFMPEGFTMKGNALQWLALYDLDFMKIDSRLTFKLMVNGGMRIPLSQSSSGRMQYLMNAGFAYIGLSSDAFVEISCENFMNSGIAPKLLHQNPRTFEVAFSENPIYTTAGWRLRFGNGVALSVYAPILLSTNQGSAMNGTDKKSLENIGDPRFADERARGITDPFDPWFSKWKLVAMFSMPLRFVQTGAELRRNFLLQKNEPGRRTMDIDAQIQNELKNGAASDTAVSPDEAKNRLEEIRKRRNEATKK